MGARNPRLGGDQRARAADPARRPDRDGRRLGAELPVRARVSQSGGRGHRGVPLRRELSAHELRLPRADARAARAVPRGASRPRAPRGGAARAGALVARRAGALRRADRPSHARRVRPQRRRRGADRASSATLGARSSGACARTSRRPPSPRRHRGGGASCAPSSRRGSASARFPFRHDRHVPDADRPRDGRRREPRPDVPERHAVAEASSSARSSSAATRSPTKRSRGATLRAEPRAAQSNSDAAAKRPPSGICAIAISIGDGGTAPDKKVGRGPGRRSDPVPMKVSKAPATPGPCSRLALGGGGLPSERDGHARSWSRRDRSRA